MPVHLVSGEVMAALAQTVTPQGCVAVCGLLDVPLDEVLGPAPRLVAVLAHARDPGNAGTVIRAADAAGADAVLLTGDSVDPYNGKCVRASAGSLFHLRWLSGDRRRATTCPPCGQPACGCSPPTATPTSTWTRPPTTGLLDGPTAWVFGNEAWGLPERDPGARRRRGQGADPRPGREPQPGHRRRGLPLRLRPGAPHSSDRLIRVRPLG